MRATLHRLAHSGIRRAVPEWLVDAIRARVGVHEYDEVLARASNPHVGTAQEWRYEGEGPWVLGLLSDRRHEHRHYMAACLELRVSYRVLDITRDNWLDTVQASGCHAFLAWPFIHTALWKGLWDERMAQLDELGLLLCPNRRELWLYESKRRARDWCRARGIEQPRTWVFFDREEARAFLASAEFPVVFKTDHGSSARGVTVCQTAREARRLVDASFARGRVIHRGDLRDRAWGYVICQEYLPDVNEWRMVRIGDSYFCRFKERKGAFHSGSGSVRWAAPPPRLLDLLRSITESAGFTSMNADIFETLDGRFLVNELHAVFGDIDPGNRERGREQMGRYQWDAAQQAWRFEPGFFYDNACANLRVEHVLSRLDRSSAASRP
jgi:hypothetical protein